MNCTNCLKKMNKIRTNQPCFEGGWGDEKLVCLIFSYFKAYNLL